MKLTRLMIGMLLALVLAAQPAPAAANHWMNTGDYGLKGKVKTIAEEQVLLQADGDRVTIPLRTISYDNEGKAVRVITYKGPGSANDQGYRYDSQGRMAAGGRYTKDGTFVTEVEYVYDGSGRLTENRYLRDDGSVFLLKTYQYDAAGNLTAEQHRTGGQIIAVKKISLDREHNETVIDTFGPDGRLLTTQTNRLDDAGTGEQQWQYHGDLGGYGIRRQTVTAEDGKLSTVCYLPDGSTYRNTVCDSVEGDVVKRTVYRADGSVMMEIYFDAAGNMTMYSRFTPAGEMEKSEKYTYQYDGQANWTVRTSYERLDNEAEWQVTGELRRLLTYYD
ncbi:MAG: hypothetical protein P4N41_02020 [Negativicutes bacterium]|nr:hypothetical protein [Negativicutes bacterium]